MAYSAICRDLNEIDSRAVRRNHLQQHLDYVANISDKILIAGPLNLDDSAEYNGSLFIYATDSDSEARVLLEQDPYFKAGLYGDIAFASFTPARGNWLKT
jgi:uncharacterized protein YciI